MGSKPSSVKTAITKGKKMNAFTSEELYAMLHLLQDARLNLSAFNDEGSLEEIQIIVNKILEELKTRLDFV